MVRKQDFQILALTSNAIEKDSQETPEFSRENVEIHALCLIDDTVLKESF